jgi:uncharacterized repeat protein (TIGR01451 family)
MKKRYDNQVKRKVVLQTSLTITVLATFVILAPLSVFSDEGNVTVQLTAQKVVARTDGTEEFLAAEEAVPGQTLLYTAAYHNRGTAAIKNLRATLPVPEGMEYLPDSAKPADVSASLDGVVFQPVPLKHKVKSPDGTEHDELVPYAQYRTLRWSVGDLAPDATVTISARAKILNLQTNPSPSTDSTPQENLKQTSEKSEK